MRNTIAASLFIFASVSAFAAQSTMTNTYEIAAGFVQSEVGTVEPIGPVCFPGDPCGPQPITLGRNVLLGPVCYPGDPCGPQPGQGMTHIAFLVGPVCYPGDPCGQPGQVMTDTASLLGPVCYPGDPCGRPGGSQILLGIASLIGPVCYPGDPCGSKPNGPKQPDSNQQYRA
jgi:hypothetical protein